SMAFVIRRQVPFPFGRAPGDQVVNLSSWLESARRLLPGAVGPLPRRGVHVDLPAAGSSLIPGGRVFVLPHPDRDGRSLKALLPHVEAVRGVRRAAVLLERVA